MAEQKAASGTYETRYKFTGKELDEISDLYYYGARYYDPRVSQFLSTALSLSKCVDPLTDKYPNWTPYNYTLNNPVRLTDPYGTEPIKPLVGTAIEFRLLLDFSPSKVGLYKGQKAKRYLLNLGNTKFNWTKFKPMPQQTGYFNKKKSRYIYTKKGGWIDMTHFMFYAGKAYQYKLKKLQAKKLLAGMKKSGISNLDIPSNIIKSALSDPIGEAIQDGYQQENLDMIMAPHSAYSYEDLPSDRFGADFAVNYFNPDSKLTLGEQIQNYLYKVLGAIAPNKAPNYEKSPKKYPKTPTRTNDTTKPIYTNDNP